MERLIDTLLAWGLQNSRSGKVKIKPGMNIVYASVYLTEDERKELSSLTVSEMDIMAMMNFWIKNSFNVRFTPKSAQGFEGVTITHTTLTYKGKSVSIQGEGKTWEKAALACFYKMACIRSDRGLELSEGVDTSDFDMR